MSSLKEEVKEIVEIVALVPEAQKAMCFELLLKEALAKRHSPPKPEAQPPAHAQKDETPRSSAANLGDTPDLPPSGAQPKVNGGSDFAPSDLHMKTRKFMEKGEVTIAQMNELFYKEGDDFQSLSVDLKVSKMSEAQVRIALLQALHNSLGSGDFETTVEAVREECKARKTYDSANFTAIFKSAADLFDFGTWSKEVTTLRLSEAGKKELAEIVKLVS
jgi:hypothetical protein